MNLIHYALLTFYQPYQRRRPGIRYRERQFDEGVKGSNYHKYKLLGG